MTIFIGTDHRGFELKNKLMEYLQEKDIRVEDMGNYTYEAQDDYTEFGKKVAQAVTQNPEEFLGIAICGSGLGMGMITNRHKGVRAGLCSSVKQAEHGRMNDHMNVLCLAAEYLTFQEAKEIVDTFINTPIKKEEKYLRRSKQLDD
jgi:ribose 5-phosphate isomerase B